MCWQFGFNVEDGPVLVYISMRQETQCTFATRNPAGHRVLVNCVFQEDEYCQSATVSLCKNMSQDLIEIQYLSRQS